jgi:hypothetical protein
MAAVRTGLTAEGSLYEALARGNKDAFFFKDSLEQSLNPFENRYDAVPPLVHELRRIPPLNGADFGRACEFEFDIAGDIFVRPTILIDLPTWLPPTEAALNETTDIHQTGTDTTYGYTNGVGYFLFSKIQVYQDKILLYEMSGDALWASRTSRGSLNSAYLENRLSGWHDGTPGAIAAAATPGRLRLELPFIGGPHYGFPSIAMRQQNFKLRLTLRKLEEIVESSDPASTVQAMPWKLESFTAETGASPYTFAPLAREKIGTPSLQLETRHIYTDGDTQLALRTIPLEIPFSRLYENTFTFGPLNYTPLERNAVAAVTNRIDARHPSSRIFWFVRSHDDLRAGRRWKVAASNPSQEYYTNQSLIIAGRDRETLMSPFIWNELTYHAKEDRDPGHGFGEMNWDMGSVVGRRAPFYERQPEGSINFTTADRPTLYTELASIPPDSILGKPSAEMTAVVDAWSIYSIENERGSLKYGL